MKKRNGGFYFHGIWHKKGWREYDIQENRAEEACGNKKRQQGPYLLSLSKHEAVLGAAVLLAEGWHMRCLHTAQEKGKGEVDARKKSNLGGRMNKNSTDFNSNVKLGEALERLEYISSTEEAFNEYLKSLKITNCEIIETGDKIIYRQLLDSPPTLEDRMKKIGLNGFLEVLRKKGWVDEKNIAKKNFVGEYIGIVEPKSCAEDNKYYVEWNATLTENSL